MAIYLTRTEPSQNMARFWTVAVFPPQSAKGYDHL